MALKKRWGAEPTPAEEISHQRGRLNNLPTYSGSNQHPIGQVKIRNLLKYEGDKPPAEYGLFTQEGVEWLHTLGLKLIESNLRVIKPLDDEVKLI
jgi:hypothetical protein